MSAPQKTLGLVVVCFLGLFVFLSPLPIDARKSVISSVETEQASVEVSSSTVYPAKELFFISNDGQFDQSVHFRADAGNGVLWFADNAVFYHLIRHESTPLDAMNPILPTVTSPAGNEEFHLVKVSIEGASPNARIVGEDKLPSVYNYFIGNDESRWHANVPLYRSISYENIYSGVSLTYYGTEEYLEYDFKVNAGVDPSIVQLKYEGIDELHLTDDGELAITTQLGTIIEGKPVIYQTNAKGKRVDIKGSYVIAGNAVSFKLGHGYDPSLPVVIDPVIRFSTFLGGSNNDYGRNVALNAARNPFVVGYTASSDFPVQAAWDGSFNGGGAGSFDAYVSKFSVTGDTLKFSTFFGGSNGEDKAFGVAVDANGRPNITGSTNSTNFPTATPFQAANGGGLDAFFVRFSANGDSLKLATYLGGSGNEEGTDIALNSSGLVHIVGYTGSSNFPTMVPYDNSLGGTKDGFLTKFATSGTTLAFSTYLGGSANDDLFGIAIDKSNNIYVAGSSTSNDFPKINFYDSSFNGGSSTGDVVVAKFPSAGGTPTYSTYIGGASDEGALDIAVDTLNRAYVCGYTASSGYPLSGPADSTFQGSFEGFVTRLSSAGSSLSYSTFVGGATNDFVNSIAADKFGQAYITGNTASSAAFPLVDAFQNSLLGSNDAFVTCINLAGNGFVYSSYLGGQFSDYGYGIAININTDSLAYITGYTGSGNFPTMTPYQSMLGGMGDAFLTMVSTTPYICFDSDGDGYGDPGHPENECPTDNCPDDSNPTQADTDADGVGNACDNCPNNSNANQLDADGDGIGDVCDPCTDTDGDGRGNPGYPANTCGVDNCPTVANASQTDTDGDGIGDACDNCTDTDGDGFGNPGFPNNTCPTDNCPTTANASQADTDGDGIGNACDNCPSVSNANQADADTDGIGNVCDLCTDTDGDGFGNPGYPANTCTVDNCPYVFNPSQSDSNHNGIGDICDAGCCVGPIRGNVNGSGDNNVNLLDLTYLINFLFNNGTPPPCPDEANVNGSPGNTVTVSDISYLVNFLFNGGPQPSACP